MKELLSRWISAWDQFWFEPADSATLGLLRWFSGGMLLYTHLVWGLALQPFFGPDGWQDHLLVGHALRDTLAPSFWWSIPPSLLGVTHAACLLILLLYWVGLFHRVTPWLAFAITVSYINRVPLANFGLDQINSLLVAYVAVGSLGLPSRDARLTADRAWFRWRQQSARGGTASLPDPQPHVSVRLALRLVQIHLCVIYFGAGLSKLKGLSWWTGDAVWLAIANREYQSQDLTWLAWTPWLINLVSVGTVAWEMTFWLLIWHPRLRWPVLLVGLGMHTGIGLFLGMWTFGLVMEMGYLAFVRPESLLAWGAWFRHLIPGSPSAPTSSEPGDSPSREIAPTLASSDPPAVPLSTLSASTSAASGPGRLQPRPHGST